MRKRAARLLGAAIAVAGLLAAAPSTGAAELSSAAGPTAAAKSAPAGAVARYEGRKINLAEGWQGAHTCVVHTRQDIRCHSDAAGADAALGYRRAADPLVRRAASPRAAAAVPACAGGWLCLYEHANGQGRRLIFNDEYWHNLYDYGFQNKTSSWRNTQSRGDSGGLRMSDTQQQIWLGAPGYVSYIGIYNDKAYMVHG
ncbi:peptidase inhibitor family I36 protein [Streptomyces sp. TRM 70361]|uniref:peptidase inhibitor family I36 protein n=1 Tax=Streptomyces sp. TRM 70361 TaxID=3116553 RepID=UPI002E7B7D19|nr:peptidase inhibitor family I36 protein [Streptomyces sp. TRM 70361]MEE1942150.1 peptidase inhibitor family I36 protein [Streptomyces sp. TRM 70361]